MAYTHFSGFSNCDCGSGANAITDLALLDTTLTYAKNNGMMGQIDLAAALKKLDNNTTNVSGKINGTNLEITDSDNKTVTIDMLPVFNASARSVSGAIEGTNLVLSDPAGNKSTISLAAIFDAIKASTAGAATETTAGAVKLGNRVLANDGTTVLGRLIGA